MEDIYNLPLDVFNLYLLAAFRVEARGRLGYIADTSASIAASFSGGSETKEYMANLTKQSLGEN